MIFKRRDYTPAELGLLRKRQILADLVLIIVLLGLSAYVVINIQEVKGIVSGDLNPCYVCEKRVTGAICKINNEDVLWSENQVLNFSVNLSGLELPTLS